MQLTCDTCGRIGNEDDGIEVGGASQEPRDGIVRAVTTSRTFIVTIEHTDDEPDGFDSYFRDYLIQPDFPFQADYGPPTRDEGDTRDDGWDGPFVISVEVKAKEG